MSRLLKLVAILALAGCSRAQSTAPTPGDRAAERDRRLLEIARQYSTYTRLTDWSQWSPLDCSLPTPAVAASRSRDDATHGRKLYYLFAKDDNAYRQGRTRTQPEGQVIVKEAWHPREIPADAKIEYSKVTMLDGRRYTFGDKAGLFVMAKRGGEWTYATMNAEGSRVLQAGAIESCLGCHRSAPHDSLFGYEMEPPNSR